MSDSERPENELSQVQRAYDQREADISANENVSELAIDSDRIFEQAMEQTRMAITITDPFRDDNPIVFANQAFVDLTGFEREEAVGRNCRFLQGPETDQRAVEELRRALAEREVTVVELLNYRKDGSTFWNMLHVGPIFDKAGDLRQFYGSQWDVSQLVEARERATMQKFVAEELQHRIGNLFSAIGSIVRLSSRGSQEPTTIVQTIEERIDALARAHQVSVGGGMIDSDGSDLLTFVETILRPYRTEVEARFTLSGPAVTLPTTFVTPLGLTLHELATNAVKYGSLRTDEGTLTVSWIIENERLVLTWTEAGGDKNPVVPTNKDGTGSRIIRGVLSSLKGTIAYEWENAGLTAEIVMPLR